MRRALVWMLMTARVSLGAPLVLSGQVAADGEAFVLVPFEVSPGTVEVEVAHQTLTADAVLDFGVWDTERARGWGGGNVEPAVIGVAASSRSYLTGPLPAGTWQVVIGKARVAASGAGYRLTITLRDVATLAPQPERRPFSPAVLEVGERWYAGDLHVHSKESGDAKPTLDAIATFAKARGLDFVELSDHNTNAQLDFISDAQTRHPGLLFIPGVEFTTYRGHANGIGATRLVDHRFGVGDASWPAAAQALVSQGAVLSINHPVLDLGQSCIGCAWRQTVPLDLLGAVEIQTGGFDKTGLLFSDAAIAFWDRQLALGSRAAPVGGSDDHSAGLGRGPFDSAIGSPTTMILARELSAAGLLEGLKAGRTVVKLHGPSDPMVDLSMGGLRIGDTAEVVSGALEVTVTGAQRGDVLRLVKNGFEQDPITLTGAELTTEVPIEGPKQGVDRYRAELSRDGQRRTVTGHLWVVAPTVIDRVGCRCSSVEGLVGLLAGLLLGRRARGRA